MIARDKWTAIQRILGTEPDGIPGPNDEKALGKLKEEAKFEHANQIRAKKLEASPILEGGPGWKWTAKVDGEDIVIENASVTWFGGDSDPLDSGETASGVMTKGNPNLMGCALPVLPQVSSTSNSPLPKIPWGTTVLFNYNHKTIGTTLVDNGPSKNVPSGAAGDLTVKAFREFSSLNQGLLKGVNIRIVGGAKYV